MMRAKIFYWLVLVSSSVCSANLKSVSIVQHTQEVSLICRFNQKIAYKIFQLEHPLRLVVDLKDTLPQRSIQPVGNVRGLIQSFRVGYPYKGTFRLVFELKNEVSYQSKMIGQRPGDYQLQIKLMDKSKTPRPSSSLKNSSTNVSLPDPIVKSNVLSAKPVRQTAVQSPTKARDLIVVIDPGHGGKDPGAMGANRHVEKDVVLSISLKLKQLIDHQPGMRAVLTRQGDYYIGLRERLQIARKYHGDIFIAIHADAFINQHSKGASVFALSQKGATSEAARWLAEKENYSELGGVNLAGLDDNNGMIRTVLLDLSQTATIQAGLQVGGYILQYLSRFTALHNAKVEQARFVVLKSPDIPSVLVETGFISNPIEERNLTNPQYQMRLSQAIFEGVNRYFYEHPVQGTRLAAITSYQQDSSRISRSKSWLSKLKHRL